jgi:hypothetical protein
MDFTTLANVKTYGDIQSTGNDTLLSSLITGYSAQIENEVNQDVSQQVYTNKALHGVIDRDGVLVVYPRTPVIQSLTAASYRIAGVAVPAAFTSLDVTNAEIDCYSHGSEVRFMGVNLARYRDMRVRVQISGTVGYSGVATGSYPVPNDLEMVCRRLVWWGYKKRDAAVEKTAIPEMGVLIIPGNWPEDVKRVLGNYKSVVAG